MKSFDERLKVLMEDAVRELQAIDIVPSEHITAISSNNRAKKRLGCCKKEMAGGKAQYRLEISALLEEKEDEVIKEVILHELLHTCPGCLNHGAKWKALARAVNEAYGYHITTTVRDEAIPLKGEYRYAICCTKCKARSYRMKRSKLIREIDRYKCGKCGGRLKVENL